MMAGEEDKPTPSVIPQGNIDFSSPAVTLVLIELFA